MVNAPVEEVILRTPRIFSIGIVVACLLPVAAESQESHRLMAQSAWARAIVTPAGTGAAYVTIMNMGTMPDRLVGARSDIAEMATLHVSTMTDGVMRMRPTEAIPVQPGEATTLQPGGYHVMLMGIKAPMREGQSFHLTLVFENAGEIETHVDVLSATAEGPHQDPGHAAMAAPEAHGHQQAMVRPTEMPDDLDLDTRKLSEQALFAVEVTSKLEPVAINQMHSWVIRIRDMSGTPIEGAEVVVTGGMPMHGHDLPTEPRVTEYLGDGQYLLEGVRFNMGGWWELKLAIASGHGHDNVTFNLVLN